MTLKYRRTVLNIVAYIGFSMVLAGLWGCSSGGSDSCKAEVNAVKDAAFNAQFNRFGEGWTGGGNVFSVLLPDGRTVWLAGPTYLGIVNPDRSRPSASPLIDNAVLIQDGTDLTTLHGGTADDPAAFFVPADPTERYTPQAALVEGNQLHVFLNVSVGIFQVERNDVATFSLPDLILIDLVTVNEPADISYGTALLEQVDFTYIYGIEAGDESGGFMHIARAAAGNLLGPWEYFDGSGWSADPATSARVLDQVASEYSVVEDGGTFFLLNQEVFGFSQRMQMLQGTSPIGPWRSRITVFCAPERNGDIITTNALAHPQFTTSGELLVSYLVNSFGTTAPIFENADNYRPIYVRMPLNEVRALAP